MGDCLLDTSFLIAYFNEMTDRVAGPARKFFARQPARTRLFTSLVALAELLEGADDPDRVEQELRALARPLGLSPQHARKAAQHAAASPKNRVADGRK